MKLSIKQPVDTALQALTDQQRVIISLRFGLDGKKRRTLQEIADQYSSSRERIRQVQNIALARLKEDECIKHLAPTIANLESTLQKCGSAANEKTLCAVSEISTKAEKNYVSLLLVIADNFKLSPETDEISQYWYLGSEHKRALDTTLKDIHKQFEKDRSTILDENRFKEVFTTAAKLQKSHAPEYGHVVHLSNTLNKNLYDEWGLAKHPEIALQTLFGYICLVLRKADKPLHFSDVVEQVSALKGSPCHSDSCHNELVRHDDFVLVGRGLYALKRMGHRAGTIYDIIVAGMKERGPMKKEDVVKYVIKERFVKPQSVILNLCRKDKFTRDEQRRYYFVV